MTQSSVYNSNQNYLTDIGAFSGSGSFYGTFDQSGTVYQWNDLNNTPGSSRGMRGSGWYDPSAGYLSSSNRISTDPSIGYDNVGFRLASSVVVPEPLAWVMGLAGIIACGGWQIFRRRRALAA